jgi:methionine sulfoxide reductase heme-binding subunit
LNRIPLLYFRIFAHALAALPFLLLAYDVFRGSLGADPVRTLTLRTGWWALFFLLATLSMTPLRRLTGSTHWIRIRRMLGIWVFFLASCHLSIYLSLDLQAHWQQIFADIVKRPYITVGFCAWLLLAPLAITSTQGMMRRMGKRWRQLHKLVYVIAPLGVLHFIWLVKKDLTQPLVFAGVLAVLLATRVLPLKRAQPAQ